MSDAIALPPKQVTGKVKEPAWEPVGGQRSTQMGLLHFIHTVWVNNHTAPTDVAALASFDVNSLMPEYLAFIRAGGKVPERGQSLEEFWLGFQLSARCPVVCLLNDVQPKQEVARITRLRRLSAPGIWAELQRVYARRQARRASTSKTLVFHHLPALVYDGNEIAHIIGIRTMRGEELHYWDSWPGRSLLCAEHNIAGVAARDSDLIQEGWWITRLEFYRVVFAVMVYPITERRPFVELTEQELQAAKLQAGADWATRQLNAGRPNFTSSPRVERIGRLAGAVLSNCVWKVKVAINEGDDPNVPGTDGVAPLHLAAEQGHLEIVKLLTEHGADWRARNAQGRTPAELAAVVGNNSVADYLESLG